MNMPNMNAMPNMNIMPQVSPNCAALTCLTHLTQFRCPISSKWVLLSFRFVFLARKPLWVIQETRNLLQFLAQFLLCFCFRTERPSRHAPRPNEHVSSNGASGLPMFDSNLLSFPMAPPCLREWFPFCVACLWSQMNQMMQQMQPQIQSLLGSLPKFQTQTPVVCPPAFSHPFFSHF